MEPQLTVIKPQVAFVELKEDVSESFLIKIFRVLLKTLKAWQKTNVRDKSGK